MKKIAIVGLLVAIVGIVFFIQCEKTEEISPIVETKSVNELIKGTWYVKSVELQRRTYKPDFPISLDFSKSETAIGFGDHGSCITKSSFSPKEHLTIEGDYACQPAGDRVADIPKELGETAYMVYTHLKGDIVFSISKGVVTLTSPTATYILEKEPVYHTPEPFKFAGTEWMIERLWQEGREHRFKDKPAVVFDEKLMTIGWSSNKCQTKYSNTIGNYLQLSVDELDCKNACCSNEMHELMILALRGRQSYRMEEGTLVLTNSTGIKLYLNALKQN